MKKRDFFRANQKKRYKDREFKNPYFSKKKSVSHKQIIRIVFTSFVVILCVYGIFRIGNKPIKSISTAGLETISEQQLVNHINTFLSERQWIFFTKSNNFFYSSEKLKTYLENIYSFESLSIEIKKQDLYVSVKEKTSQLLWSSGNDVFLVDLSGIVIRRLFDEEIRILAGELPEVNQDVEMPEKPHLLTTLPLFKDVNDAEVKIGESVLSEEEVTNIFRFHDHLSAQGVGYLETRIDRLAGKWMAIRTQRGFDILFDASGDIDAQASNLETLFRDTINPDQSLEYIDLRFGDRVYFK
jgi:hypothetical protein